MDCIIVKDKEETDQE